MLKRHCKGLVSNSKRKREREGGRESRRNKDLKLVSKGKEGWLGKREKETECEWDRENERERNKEGKENETKTIRVR
jgi:hypothetical protein